MSKIILIFVKANGEKQLQSHKIFFIVCFSVEIGIGCLIANIKYHKRRE